MRRHFRWDKKYWFWGMTAFAVIAAAILFYMALSYLPVLGNGLKKFSRILSPFIWGLVITYLLTPMMKSLERNFFSPLSRRIYKKKWKYRGRRFSRAVADSTARRAAKAPCPYWAGRDGDAVFFYIRPMFAGRSSAAGAGIGV